MIWRWLALAALVLIGLLLFAHAAGVDLWTWASGLGALVVTAAALLRRPARPSPAPDPVKVQSRAEEATNVETAAGEAKLEELQIEEHHVEEQKKPLGDRAQELIDRNRARRGQ